ncbi:MAG TPA: sigma-70 family RNA polymerase sigma factor [Chloroflexia bacterium]|nr:sigma-70 family RNA polymerase sigma factor [Chloroflexia bacterium]
MREIEMSELEELAWAAKGGDREARNSLFLKYQVRIKRLALPAKRMAARIAPDDMSIEPEDVEQQAFLIFCELLEQWEPGRAPFAVYLTNVMQWRLGHYVREATHSRRKRAMRPSRDGDEAAEPSAKSIGELMDARLEEVESREAWHERTKSVSKEGKHWLTLRFAEGLSTRQIAALSGRTKRTVNRGLRAAMSEVRKSLQEECA